MIENIDVVEEPVTKEPEIPASVTEGCSLFRVRPGLTIGSAVLFTDCSSE